MKHSSLSSRRVSETNNKPNQHGSNSAIKFSQRDWPRMFCKFSVMTCTHTFPRDQHHSLQPEMDCPHHPLLQSFCYQKSQQCTVPTPCQRWILILIFAPLPAHCSHHSTRWSNRFSHMRWTSIFRCHGQWLWTTCNWQWHFGGTCLPTQSKTFFSLLSTCGLIPFHATTVLCHT